MVHADDDPDLDSDVDSGDESEVVRPAAERPRRFQFSLWSLMVLVACVGVLLGLARLVHWFLLLAAAFIILPILAVNAIFDNMRFAQQIEERFIRPVMLVVILLGCLIFCAAVVATAISEVWAHYIAAA